MGPNFCTTFDRLNDFLNSDFVVVLVEHSLSDVDLSIAMLTNL